MTRECGLHEKHCQVLEFFFKGKLVVVQKVMLEVTNANEKDYKRIDHSVNPLFNTIINSFITRTSVNVFLDNFSVCLFIFCSLVYENSLVKKAR